MNQTNSILNELIQILERIKKKMMTFGNNKKELNNFLSEYKNDKDFNEFILKLQDVNTNNLPNSNFVGKNIIESEEYIIDEQNYYSMDRYVIKKGFGLKTHDHINIAFYLNYKSFIIIVTSICLLFQKY